MASKITRKTFLLSNLAVPSVAVGLLAASCGDDDDDMPGSNNGGSGGQGVDSCEADVAVADLHTHAVTIPAEDVEAGEAATFMLSAASGHTHTLTLDAEDMAALAQGDTVTATSSTDSGHSHSVSISC